VHQLELYVSDLQRSNSNDLNRNSNNNNDVWALTENTEIRESERNLGQEIDMNNGDQNAPVT